MAKDKTKHRTEISPVISPLPDFMEPTPKDISESIQDNEKKVDEPRINV